MSNKHAKSSRKQAGNSSSVNHRVEQFSGPVPHPDLLKKYDEVLPGLAERLVTLAERSVEAEVQLKNKALMLNKAALAGIIWAVRRSTRSG